jgi:hypothetical protein
MRTPLIIFVAALIVTSPSAAWAGGKGGSGGGGGGQNTTSPTAHTLGYGQIRNQYYGQGLPRTNSPPRSFARGVHLPKVIIHVR